MAEPVDFTGSNMTFNSPDGRTDVGSLKAFSNDSTLITCWKLTAEDLAEVLETGTIYVSQMCGRTLYPMFVGRRAAVRGMAIEYGSKTIPQVA